MAYSVKELHYTLQGEGAMAGRAAVFCRFAGCNLWNGREEDRSEATCNFCDTDFIGTDGPGGGVFTSPDDLAKAIAETWSPAEASGGAPFVVFTGGEPLLQLNEALVDACHRAGFEVAVETNGTLALPEGIDWVTVSPKTLTDLVLQEGHELKLVFPQKVTPESVASLRFDRFFLQPLDGPDLQRNMQLAVDYCRNHPQWRLSLQTHKVGGFL